MIKRKSPDANDLVVDDPKHVRLRAYSVSMLGPRKDALMLLGIRGGIKFDAAFCFRCRNFEFKAGGDFRGMRCESTFTTNCYRNWKHAIKLNGGYSKITASKKHLACYST